MGLFLDLVHTCWLLLSWVCIPLLSLLLLLLGDVAQTIETGKAWHLRFRLRIRDWLLLVLFLLVVVPHMQARESDESGLFL